jgi:hypothetical protein
MFNNKNVIKWVVKIFIFIIDINNNKWIIFLYKFIIKMINYKINLKIFVIINLNKLKFILNNYLRYFY